MEVKISDLIGPRCITKDDGQRVYEAIHRELKNRQTITLDFEEVKQFASPFFNFAIGQLLRDNTVEDLRQFLRFVNLVSDGQLVVDRVIENATRYHKDVDYKEIVDSILHQQAEELG
ncbi:MAG: STAS-like domain-containing protein [Thermodesulfobacteriota bacterium]|nr:STAS-like domain-containing protein [Thermodesulfobacteriota bacterium]